MFKYLEQAENGVFDQRSSRFYAACVMLGLDALHCKGYVYRDLKPENLLIDVKGYVKIADFGFAKRVTGKTFTLCGTPDYMAPEIITRKGHNKAADFWALGVLVYEMLVGFGPFTPEEPENTSQTYRKILSGRYGVPRRCGREAIDLISKLLVQDPEAGPRGGICYQKAE
jgi:serine/threonine protein kinase